MKKFCRTCGKKIEAEAEICVYCGVRVKKEEPKKQGVTGWNWFWLIFWALLCWPVAIFYAVYMVFKGK